MTISIEEMKRDISGYLQRVKAGETIIITEKDTPVAEVKSVAQTPSITSTEPVSDQRRPIGLYAGQFTVPDDFDAPLPDDILNEFEGR
jgi:prevent-host-death family protein